MFGRKQMWKMIDLSIVYSRYQRGDTLFPQLDDALS